MKTDSTFWSQLQVDIERYSLRAKKNIKEVKKKHYTRTQKSRTHSRSVGKHYCELPESIVCKAVPYSINQIREKHREENQTASKMKNEVQYLEIQKNRKLQSRLIAKQRYSKVVQIRSQTLKDRKFISEQLSTFKNQYYLSRHQQTSQIREEKKRVQLSQKNLIQEKSRIARSVRMERQRNNEILSSKMSEQEERKQGVVLAVQQAEARSAEKLKSLSKHKAEMARVNHQKRIWDQYKKLQLKNNNNAEMAVRFRQKVKSIQNEKIKAEEDLKVYRQVLGLQRFQPNPERLSATMRCKKTLDSASRFSNSFYVTS